jgi:hypothetical protein
LISYAGRDTSNSGTTQFNFGDVAGPVSGGDPLSVPEPTSALLFIGGLAGVVIRRRLARA